MILAICIIIIIIIIIVYSRGRTATSISQELSIGATYLNCALNDLVAQDIAVTKYRNGVNDELGIAAAKAQIAAQIDLVQDLQAAGLSYEAKLTEQGSAQPSIELVNDVMSYMEDITKLRDIISEQENAIINLGRLRSKYN